MMIKIEPSDLHKYFEDTEFLVDIIEKMRSNNFFFNEERLKKYDKIRNRLGIK